MTDDSSNNSGADRAKALVELVHAQAGDPFEGEIRTATFEDTSVRGHFHEGEWWLSIVDIIKALAVSDRPSKYWTDLRTRLIETEGFSELSAKIGKLKMPSEDGKLRGTEAANVKTLFRVLQSVPSPKVEPLKQWLAQVGYERLQEEDDPSVALERLIGIYLSKGRTPEWIRERIDGIIARRELTHEWLERGIRMRNHYAILTRMLQIRSLGVGPKEHRIMKGLSKRMSLRDHSTEIELLLTRLGERATIEIAKADDAQGYEQNREAVKKGGDIAKTARLKLEKLTGARVASASNFLKAPAIISNAASIPSSPGSPDEPAPA